MSTASMLRSITKGIDTVTPNSFQSLFLEMMFEKQELACGTGFVVTEKARHFLITARHNLTGRHQADGTCLSKNGGIPNKIRIWHNSSFVRGTWLIVEQPLYDDEEPLWFEHPTLGANADFVALPLNVEKQPIALFPYDLRAPNEPLRLLPTDDVSVIGFPFKVSVRGKLPIWTTGSIASEPAFDYEDMPRFLIDSRTRKGQSGAPVVAFRSIFARFKERLVALEEPHSEFLGVYSGRINTESDLGIVWRREAIAELVDAAAPST